MTAVELLIALLLVGANGFFVVAEFAMVTSRAERLERMAADGRRGAQLALDCRRDLPLQLAGAQLGVTMASLGLGFVGEPVIGRLLEHALAFAHVPDGLVNGPSIVLALLLVAFPHLVLGEMVPKNLTLANPERALVLVVRPYRLYVRLFGPVLRVLSAVARAGVRLFGVEPRDELGTVHTAAEIARMVAASREEGVIEESEHDLLSGALDFGARPVSEVMVPREQMVVVSLRTTVAEVERIVVTKGHSRLPVIGADLDDVLGFLHVKDLLPLPAASQRLPVRAVRRRRMLQVRADERLDEVLPRMQRRRLHLALVVDEAGKTVGMATLEDVLEAFVGDIRDESDPTP